METLTLNVQQCRINIEDFNAKRTTVSFLEDFNAKRKTVSYR